MGPAALVRHLTRPHPPPSLPGLTTLPHPQGLLELMVGALYASSIDLGADNVEPIYRAADAMQARRPPLHLEALPGAGGSGRAARSLAIFCKSRLRLSVFGATGCTRAHAHTLSSQPTFPARPLPAQMPALMAACESYLAATCFDDPEADPEWVGAVYDLACDLSR